MRAKWFQVLYVFHVDHVVHVLQVLSDCMWYNGTNHMLFAQRAFCIHAHHALGRQD